MLLIGCNASCAVVLCLGSGCLRCHSLGPVRLLVPVGGSPPVRLGDLALPGALSRSLTRSCCRPRPHSQTQRPLRCLSSRPLRVYACCR